MRTLNSATKSVGFGGKCGEGVWGELLRPKERRGGRSWEGGGGGKTGILRGKGERGAVGAAGKTMQRRWQTHGGACAASATP